MGNKHRTHTQDASQTLEGTGEEPKHQDNSTRGLHSTQQRMTVLAEYT